VPQEEDPNQMTDHRVTDLSYGHLGQATYDPEAQEWTFSVDVNQGNP